MNRTFLPRKRWSVAFLVLCNAITMRYHANVPQTNWAFNADATAGRAFGVFMGLVLTKVRKSVPFIPDHEEAQ